MPRRLIITTHDTGFTTETSYQTATGSWSVLSRTVTTRFPFHLVERIAARADYRIHIRSILLRSHDHA